MQEAVSDGDHNLDVSYVMYITVKLEGKVTDFSGE